MDVLQQCPLFMFLHFQIVNEIPKHFMRSILSCRLNKKLFALAEFNGYFGRDYGAWNVLGRYGIGKGNNNE